MSIVADVNVVLDGEDARVPNRVYMGDAGHDLFTDRQVTVKPGGYANLPTGVSMELPPGFWAMIVGRSSASTVVGVLVVPGIIDNGYRGELFVRVYNPSNKAKVILKHQRLGQVIVMPLTVARFKQTKTLGHGDRGSNGFGSTGG